MNYTECKQKCADIRAALTAGDRDAADAVFAELLRTVGVSIQDLRANLGTEFAGLRKRYIKANPAPRGGR